MTTRGQHEADMYAARLESASVELRAPLTDAQLHSLLALLAQLVKWNRTYNLTALRSTEQMLVHHLFDSLAVIAPLREWIAESRIASPRILDVGSGGGLPGIVLAIAMPECSVLCVDAVEKKISFIRQMAGVLKLGNLSAQHTRVESLATPPFDVVISRAFASLSDFARLAGHHVAPRGALVAMKGKHPGDEIDALLAQGHWTVSRTQQLTVPELQAERCLIWLQRRESQ